MKKRLYITPDMLVVHVALEGVICDSRHEMPIGGSGDDFAAPGSRRHSDWEDYETR